LPCFTLNAASHKSDEEYRIAPQAKGYLADQGRTSVMVPAVVTDLRISATLENVLIALKIDEASANTLSRR
jgi:hypothetical protein